MDWHACHRVKGTAGMFGDIHVMDRPKPTQKHLDGGNFDIVGGIPKEEAFAKQHMPKPSHVGPSSSVGPFHVILPPPPPKAHPPRLPPPPPPPLSRAAIEKAAFNAGFALGLSAPRVKPVGMV